MELATGDLVRSMREQLRSLDLKPSGAQRRPG